MEDPRFRDPRAPVAVADDGRSVRLQKALADAGIAARRAAEDLVREGRVRVNGRVVRELPCWVNPERDLIEVDGEVLRTGRAAPATRGTRAQFAYVLLNKPKGVISTASDQLGRANVVAMAQPLLPRGERIFPVGRLDADSTGLMLLTNDGELAYRLTHPRFGIGKEYHVTVQGTVDAELLARLKKGMYLAAPAAIAGSKAGDGAPRAALAAGRRARLDEVKVLRRQTDRSRGDLSLLSVTLHEGQNREIRRLLARVGLKVRKLERVALGPLKLHGLRPGAARLLSENEIAALRAFAQLGS